MNEDVAAQAPEAAATEAPAAVENTAAETEQPKVDAIAAGLKGETVEANKAEPPAGLPEKYEFHLPEGLAMTPEIEGKFTEIAHKIGLTQEQADGLVQLHSDILLDQMRQVEKQKTAWAQECNKAGLAAPEKIRAAKMAIDTFDDTGALTKELLDSGLAYSPTVQRFLQCIGSYLIEDTAPDSKPAPQPKSAADLLFANSNYTK